MAAVSVLGAVAAMQGVVVCGPTPHLDPVLEQTTVTGRDGQLALQGTIRGRTLLRCREHWVQHFWTNDGWPCCRIHHSDISAYFKRPKRAHQRKTLRVI